MNHDEIRDLLGAYALDAVDPDERDLVERHLAGCARCRAEVQDHRETAALLAHGGGDAPTGVWQRIERSLEAPPPDMRLVSAMPPLAGVASGRRQGGPASDRPTRPGAASRGRRVRTAVVAALTAAAVVVAVLGIQVFRQGQRIDDLQVALRDPLASTFEATLADPGAQVVELTSGDGSLALRGAIGADGRGYLRATDLPRLGEDRTYQLWGAAGDELISLGVIGPDPGIVEFTAEPYSTFAITEEGPAGVVTPINPPVVAGQAV